MTRGRYLDMSEHIKSNKFMVKVMWATNQGNKHDQINDMCNELTTENEII